MSNLNKEKKVDTMLEQGTFGVYRLLFSIVSDNQDGPKGQYSIVDDKK